MHIFKSSVRRFSVFVEHVVLHSGVNKGPWAQKNYYVMCEHRGVISIVMNPTRNILYIDAISWLIYEGPEIIVLARSYGKGSRISNLGRDARCLPILSSGVSQLGDTRGKASIQFTFLYYFHRLTWSATDWWVIFTMFIYNEHQQINGPVWHNHNPHDKHVGNNGINANHTLTWPIGSIFHVINIVQQNHDYHPKRNHWFTSFDNC